MPVSYSEFVKAPNQEIEYTSEIISELNKCYNDWGYFIKTYVKIVTGDHGVVSFGDYMYPFQKELIDTFLKHRFTITLSGRQAGKTAIVGAYALAYACFTNHKVIGIVSNKEASAKSFLSRIKYQYEQLPVWLKPGVISWAEKSVLFENRCKIFISATSKDSFRGEPVNCLICDELAFVDPPWKAEEFWRSNYPTISSSITSQIIIISTINGMYNLFHRLYTGAEKGKNTFKHSFYDWRAVPWRDDAWAEEQKKNMGKLAFTQEFECIALGSSSTVIDPDVLENLQNVWKDPSIYDLNEKLRVYEKPLDGSTYVIGVDVAKGTGRHYSTCQILKIESTNPLKLQQVAVFQNNFVDVYGFAQIINKLCYYYNNAFLMVENNADGAAVVTQLHWEYENENLVNSGSKSKDLGIRATRITKPKAVLFMKKLIEDYSLTLIDENTIKELNDFVEKGDGKYVANNFDDDLVSGLYWACYLFQMKDIVDDIDFLNKKESNEDDAWGILSDINDYSEGDDYIIM